MALAVVSDYLAHLRQTANGKKGIGARPRFLYLVGVWRYDFLCDQSG
jgi:hypothetical protein